MPPAGLDNERQPEDLKFRWLTPEKATDYAYDMHVVQDPYASTAAKMIAQKAIDHLLSFSPQPDTKDGWYYAGVLSNVVSHGNGITNRKRVLATKLESIHKFETKMQGQMGKSQIWSTLFRAGWRTGGGPIVMGALVFFFTKVLSLADMVPQFLLNEKGHTETVASALAAIVVAIITGVIVNWWNNYRDNRFSREIRNLRHEADTAYEEGKKLELQTHWIKLNKLRHEYVEEETCDMPAYSRVYEGDIAMKNAFNQREIIAAQSDFSQLWGQASRSVNQWWMKRKNNNGRPQTNGTVSDAP